MIRLHRLGAGAEPFLLNPDLIVMIEATPDTVATLTTGARVVVCESPEEVVRRVREWRIDVVAEAVARSPRALASA